MAEVGLDDGQTFQARLIVGADGARSRTRQLAGMLLSLVCKVLAHLTAFTEFVA